MAFREAGRVSISVQCSAFAKRKRTDCEAFAKPCEADFRAGLAGFGAWFFMGLGVGGLGSWGDWGVG